jgi:hypothetical protein
MPLIAAQARRPRPADRAADPGALGCVPADGILIRAASTGSL